MVRNKARRVLISIQQNPGAMPVVLIPEVLIPVVLIPVVLIPVVLIKAG